MTFWPIWKLWQKGWAILACEHLPVLLDAVLEGFSTLPQGSCVLDVTLGLGGYSEALLQAGFSVCGLDQDPQALELARRRLEPYGERFVALRGNFRHARSLTAEAGFEAFDGLVADLGVSNLQITEGDRGFSFRLDGPLDMRMDSSSSLTAALLVNGASERELADLFWRYGEERLSRKIASAILRRRKEKSFETTAELAELVEGCYPASMKRKWKQHPARRVFQALRIAVNDELGALDDLLASVPPLLRQGGVAQFVSYHSLEDRRVKSEFRALEEQGEGVCRPRKSITPDEGEVERNPKARSARLRRWIKEPHTDGKGRPGLCRR